MRTAVFRPFVWRYFGRGFLWSAVQAAPWYTDGPAGRQLHCNQVRLYLDHLDWLYSGVADYDICCVSSLHGIASQKYSSMTELGWQGDITITI